MYWLGYQGLIATRDATGDAPIRLVDRRDRCGEEDAGPSTPVVSRPGRISRASGSSAVPHRCLPCGARHPKIWATGVLDLANFRVVENDRQLSTTQVWTAQSL